MINKIEIKNFKSLKDISIRPTNLNLLVGLNSMGKSSIIQSLLLLKQSYSKNNGIRQLNVNGDLISLGNSRDIFFQNADETDKLQINLSDEYETLKFSFKYDSTFPTFLEGDSFISDKLKMVLFSDECYYLNAIHISPSKIYKIADFGQDKMNLLGSMGENAPYYLAKHGNEEFTNKTLHHPKAKSKTLAHELDAWLSEISPGTKIVAQYLSEIDLVKINVQFETRTNEEGNPREEYSNEFAPINVGLGIPHVLPLILLILIAKPGNLILIENPETHLHPRGQAQLGHLLSLAAESGIQIFCETHSDHVINGARVAVKNKIIKPQNIKLFYFQKNEDATLETVIDTINVDAKGEFDKYPKGLLDEWGDLMAQLL